MEQIKQGYVTPGALPDNSKPTASTPSSPVALVSAASAAADPTTEEPVAKRAKLDDDDSPGPLESSEETSAALDEGKARTWSVDQSCQWLAQYQLGDLSNAFTTVSHSILALKVANSNLFCF